MCGIVGYLGPQEAYPILIDGLKRLEYRGYDSAGIATLEGPDDLRIEKKQGKVANLEAHVGGQQPRGTVGIGHTRWATHGPPSDVNAHPHAGGQGHIAVIHNGIIENYEALRELLTHRGHNLVSDTDTEVLAHFIEEVQLSTGLDLPDAIRTALKEVVGAYALVVIDQRHPDRLIAARKSSPLVIGVGQDNEFFVGSDATPIVAHTQNVIYLEDEEVATMHRNGELTIRTIGDAVVTPEIHAIEMEMASLEKAGYDHFMLKEIFEQPKSIRDSIRGRIRLQARRPSNCVGNRRQLVDGGSNAQAHPHFGVWNKLARWAWWVNTSSRAWRAFPVEVEYASEFRYRNPIIRDRRRGSWPFRRAVKPQTPLRPFASAKEARTHTSLGCATWSGRALRTRNRRGGLHPRRTRNWRGQHQGIHRPSRRVDRHGPSCGSSDWGALDRSATFMRLDVGPWTTSPDLVGAVPRHPPRCHRSKSPKLFAGADNALYLGRGYQFPVALEGALKLKEISYIHAEGYPAAEMKHGPIALIDENMPVIFIATQDEVYEKVVSNIQEVKARGGQILAIVTEGDTQGQMPWRTTPFWKFRKCRMKRLHRCSPSIPMQLLSYHIALLRGCNVDQPRNLAKSVTVE